MGRILQACDFVEDTRSNHRASDAARRECRWRRESLDDDSARRHGVMQQDGESHANDGSDQSDEHLKSDTQNLSQALPAKEVCLVTQVCKTERMFVFKVLLLPL